jgi:hypothetical protein
MSILNKFAEAKMLRAEGDRVLAGALADRIASVARSAGKIWRQAWDLTTRETSFQLQSGPGRRVGH